MHGPKISDPSKTDSRDVPLNDVAAYQAAGWVVGEQPISEELVAADNAVAEPAEEQKPIKSDKRKAKKK